MIKEIEFKIFTENIGFKFSENILVYTLLFSGLGIAFLSNQYLSNITMENIGKGVGVFGCMLSIYFKITQGWKQKPLHGHLHKKLIFRTDYIIMDDLEFPLDDIKKIEFFINDYFYKRESQAPGDFEPGRSNGVFNICELTLCNNQKIRVSFQLMYEEEFMKMRDLLIHYYSENKIHFLKLIEYLEIEEYEEIQDFKRTLSTTLHTATTENSNI